jgi:multidrug efflux pump subunit AcrA (membrane-fusion protein)
MTVYRVFLVGAALTFTGCWGCRRVVTIHAQRKELIETVYASGKIVPGDEYSLAALCTGRIVRKFVRDGETVHKGQVLFEVSAEDAHRRADAAAGTYAIAENNLSDRGPRLKDLELALQNANLRLQNDSLVYFRWKQLWIDNIGSRTNLDNCRINYEMARNEKRIAEQKYQAAMNELQVTRNNARTQLSAVQKELEEYSIRSDREGIVYQTFKEAGEAVRLNEVVALVGSSRRPEIRLAVDQQDIGRIAPGQTILVQSDAAGDRIYAARVIRIYPVMNEVDQTFRVDAEFSGEAPSFIHSSVEANIIIRRKQGCLVLPRTALAAKDSVRIGERGGWRMVQVKTGISTLDDVEILSGIDERAVVRPPAKTEEP